jgi:hypothetical protein
MSSLVSSSNRVKHTPTATTCMHRFIIAGITASSLFIGTARAQQTTAAPIAPIAPAVITTDSSGNLLVVERRGANSIPAAAPTAMGLVTRIVVIPPNGAAQSSQVYAGTMGNFHPGKRATYTIFTVSNAGKTTRYLVAIDAGAGGTLLQTLPSVVITNTGTSDIRVVPTATGNKDAIYIVQQPSTVRRPLSTTTTNSSRSIMYVEFGDAGFSTPKTVIVQ